MLLPIQDTGFRAPLGICDKASALTTFEGGMVGEIVEGDAYGTQCEVVLYDDVDDTDGNPLVGLIDDSSTGSRNSGASNSSLFGALVDGTAIGPSSTFASGKMTLWLDGGLYMTDEFAASVTNAITVGTNLVTDATGRLATVGNGASGDVVVAKVLAFTEAGGDPTGAPGFLAPRVQPFPANTDLLLVRLSEHKAP